MVVRPAVGFVGRLFILARGHRIRPALRPVHPARTGRRENQQQNPQRHTVARLQRRRLAHRNSFRRFNRFRPRPAMAAAGTLFRRPPPHPAPIRRRPPHHRQTDTAQRRTPGQTARKHQPAAGCETGQTERRQNQQRQSGQYLPAPCGSRLRLRPQTAQTDSEQPANPMEQHGRRTGNSDGLTLCPARQHTRRCGTRRHHGRRRNPLVGRLAPNRLQSRLGRRQSQPQSRRPGRPV